MEAIWALNQNNNTLWLEMGETVGWEELRAIFVGQFFRHALAIGLNLLFLVSVILELCWTRCKFRMPLPPTPPVPFDSFSSKFKLRIMQKLALGGCIFLCICYSVLGIWIPVYWWLKERPEGFANVGEYIVQALTWFTMSAYVHRSIRKEGKQKFPLLLQLWWSLSFILQAFFIVLDIQRLTKQRSVAVDIFVEIMAVLILACLCYTSCARSGVESSSQTIREPLLKDNSQKRGNIKAVSTYATANLLSRLSFFWMSPLLAVGYKSPLHIDDVPQVAEVDRAGQLYQKFRDQLEAKGHTGSLAKALILSFPKAVLLTAFLAALQTCAIFVGPYSIDAFVQFLDGKKELENQGYVLFCALFGAKVLESLSRRQGDFKQRQLALRVRAALTAIIYRKGLLLSSQSRQKHTSGEIINYMSVDVLNVSSFCYFMHQFWIMPLRVVLASIIIYQQFGLAVFSALAASLAVMLPNLPVAKLQQKFQKRVMGEKDKRMKATSETLKIMRILKLQSWETRFLRKLEIFRQVEYSWLQKYVYASAIETFVFSVGPTFISVATFGTCMLIGEPLTAGKFLSALATFGSLQGAIGSVPHYISQFVQAKVSIDRIVAFLQEEELQHDGVEEVSKESTDFAIQIQGGIFSWNPDSSSPTIRGLDVQIERGMRVAVCGTVGSGKSSLLSCILGEIPKISGSVNLSGTKAYVPQSPWIQSGKIKDAILFGKQMDNIRYNSVLEACALKKDLELFPYGDETDIGERGLNLSGGQKQRIQIARALYQDVDIYIFDDPFSAVDAHTGKHIFQECILGILASKTVVYVTHQVEFLPSADIILVMRDGEITQVGRYDDILQSGTDFVELIGAHQKALKAISAMEKSEVYTSERFVESSCPGDTAAVKNITASETPKQCGVQNSIDVEEEVEPENHKERLDKENKNSQLVQEEERERGRVNMSVYWSYITAYNGALIPIILMAQIIAEVLKIISNQWMGTETPTNEHGSSPVTNSHLLLVYVALTLSSSMCVLVSSILLSFFGLKTANQLFSNLHRCIFRAPMSFFDATPSGRILNRASTDQNAVDTSIPTYLGYLAVVLIQLLGTIAYMSVTAWQVFIVFIPVGATCIWYQKYYIPSARELSRLASVCRAPIVQHFGESISGAAIIRSFDQESRFMERNLELTDIFTRPSLHSGGASAWLGIRIDFLSNLVFAFLLVFLIRLPGHVISPSIAGLAVTYGLSLSMLQGYVIMFLSAVETNMISAERIMQYSRIPSESPVIIENCRPNSNWPSRGTIDLTDLQVRYGPHLPLVLKGLTCTFPGGTKVGVVGRTGSGKSTLIQSIFRIVEPTKGRIVIDGVDISSIGLHDLRSKLSIIPQEPTMFEGTIRNNLDPLEEYSDDDIWKALDKCQLGEIVRAKEKKLDASVAENGGNWSVGQCQLVCLGRALLKQRRILVLDEATASVDSATDGFIQQIIRHQFSTCTVITIAHRIPSVIDSDMVLLLKDGQIAEYDTPSKLLGNKSSAFAKLVSEYSIQ